MSLRPPYPCSCRRPGPAIIAAFLATILLNMTNQCIDGFAPPAPVPMTSIGTRSNNISTKIFVGSGIDDSSDNRQDAISRAIEDGRGNAETSLMMVMDPSKSKDTTKTSPSALWETLTGNGPPLDVEDTNLLLYDVFLIMNLSASISLFVVHRMDTHFSPSSLNEGAILSICWIMAGLANGAFLNSAVDGHYDPRISADEYADKGGPNAAGLLAVSTFVTTSSLRIVFALALAVLHHRPVGLIGSGEELISLEIPFGLVLMSAWRTLHSANTPRI